MADTIDSIREVLQLESSDSSRGKKGRLKSADVKGEDEIRSHKLKGLKNDHAIKDGAIE